MIVSPARDRSTRGASLPPRRERRLGASQIRNAEDPTSIRFKGRIASILPLPGERAGVRGNCCRFHFLLSAFFLLLSPFAAFAAESLSPFQARAVLLFKIAQLT